jgi:hypothetical protein
MPSVSDLLEYINEAEQKDKDLLNAKRKKALKVKV